MSVAENLFLGLKAKSFSLFYSKGRIGNLLKILKEFNTNLNPFKSKN